MERFVLVKCIVFLVLIIFGNVATSKKYEIVEVNRLPEKKFLSLFNPWIGYKNRHKREAFEDYVKYPELDRQQQQQQQLSSWILASNDVGDHYPSRMNRNENEMTFTNERWLDIDLASRSPPFAPRLGRRNMSPFIPRLGRDNNRTPFI